MHEGKISLPKTVPTLCGSISTNPSYLVALMHNSAYKAAKAPFVYVSFGIKDTKKAIDFMRAFGIRGFGVSMPHKIKVMKYLDKINGIAKEIGAVNTIVNDNGILTGFNTDWLGAVKALEEKVNLRNKKAVVVGAGGVARAIVYGLKTKKSGVVIYNRSASAGKSLAKRFGVKFGGDLEDLKFLDDYDILIQATSVGLNNPKENIVPEGILKKGKVVLDVLISPPNTKLIKDAKKAGCVVISGARMMLYQGGEQFKLYVNEEAPFSAMEKAVKRELFIK